MGRTLASLLSLALLFGCGPSNGNGGGGGVDGGGGGGGGADADTSSPDPDAAGEPGDADGDGVPDLEDNCPGVANAGQMDGDGDSIGDSCDCDPADGDLAAYLVIEDDLTQDRGRFATAPGFPAGAWTYNGGYRQNQLDDERDDAAFLIAEEDLTNVRVELTAASTEIAQYDEQDLRQLSIIARATSSASAFSAHVCGIEVDETRGHTQTTAVLQLGGDPGDVTTTVKERVDRESVVENEEFTMTLDLQGTTMTCRVVLDGVDVTTAQATDVPLSAGSVGFHTRETKALFKDLKVCRYP